MERKAKTREALPQVVRLPTMPGGVCGVVSGCLCLLVAMLFVPSVLLAQTNVITTVAGQGAAGVPLSLPTGVAVDATGNLYVADTSNCVIWKITNGVSSVFAGIPGNCSPGSGTNLAQLSLQYPIDVVSCNGNVYFATHGFDPILTNSGSPPVGGLIYEIDARGNLTTLPTPSVTTQSGPTFPVALACDRSGNVFVSSYFYLAEISFYGSVDEIPAGSQTTQNWISLFNTAYPGIAVDGIGDLFALQTSSVLQGWLGMPSFSQGGGIVELFSSGGSSTEQTISTGGQLTNPSRLTLDANGNFYVTQAAAAASPTVYVTSVPQFGGAQTTFAGNGIAGFSGDGLLPTHAELNNPTGMVFDGCGSLYIADASNGRVRKVLNSATASSASCTTGTSGPGGASGTTTTISLTSSAMQVTAPQTISFYSTVFVNNCFSCSSPLQGEVSFCAAVAPSTNPCGPGGVTIGTVLVNGSSTTSLTNYSFLISANLLNYSFPIPGTYSVAAIYSDSPTDPNGVLPSSTSTPLAVTVCGASCTDPGIPNIPLSTYPVALTPGVLSTAFSGLGAVAFDASGNRYFLNSAAGTVTRFDSGGGSTPLIPSVGFPTSLNNPSDMVVGSDGNLYITDTGNNQLVKVVGPATTTPTVSVITPTPALAVGFGSPTGIFETGAEVYVSDTGNNRVVALRPDGTFPSVIFSSATPGAPAIGSLQGIVVNPISLQIYIANAPASGSSSPGNIIVTSIGGSASVLATPGVTLQSPFGLALDPSNGLYFSDIGTHQIYRMDVHGNILVVAGNGTTTPFSEGVSATQTGLVSPTWLALDLSNSIWFADAGTLPPSVRQVDVTKALADFTAAGQSQTIYLTSPVSGVQGSVGFAMPSPLITGSGSADFSVSSSSPCLSIFPVLSPNTSCALFVTLNTAGLSSTAYIDFQSEIEISTGSFNPNTSLTQVITLNGAPSAGTTPLTLTPTVLAAGTVGTPYGPFTIQVTGGGGQVTFTVSSGVLVPGLTLSSAGVLSGTPTQFSIFSFTITAKDTNGDSGSQFYSLAVTPATALPPTILGITPSSGPASGGETVNIAGQSFQNGATVFFGSTPATPVTFISSTSLSVVVPALNVIGGASAVGVTVTNPDGQSATLASSFVVVAPPPPPVSVTVSETITVADAPTFPDVFDAETIHVQDTVSVRAYAPLIISPVGPLQPGVVSNPYPSVTFGAVGGAGGPLVLTESGSIPGMGFASGAGSLTLSGTPTAASSGYTFSISVTDALGDSATQNYVLGVSAACQSITVSPSGLLAAASLGSIYQQQFSQVGAVGNVTWSSSGTLPPGLTLSPSGLLSGTPTTANAYSFAIIATDQNGCSSGATPESLTVNGPVLPPAIVSVSETIKVNDAVSFPDVFDPETIHVNDIVSLITLQSIAVTPANPTIAEGASVAFTATGTFSDGSTQNLTSAVTWSSTNAVATMNGSTATAATGHTLGTLGTTTITATLGSTHGSTVLTVNSHLSVTAKLTSITLASNGTYVVKLAITNNGDIAASQVTPGGILGTKLDSSAIPALNIAPGATATVTLVFPATAGRPGTKQNLSVAGLATGINPNGTPVLPALWALQPTPTQVILP